jgi:hypothetical protein
VKTEEIRVGAGGYSDQSGTLHSTGSYVLGAHIATIYKPTYSFTFDGTERKATDVCGEYLALLGQMVARFKADHP